MILLVLAVGCAEQKKEAYGSISGKVTPIGEEVIVQAIQNGSIIKQINVREDGIYNLTGLPEGKYGLLFLKDEYTYSYNDEINQNLLFENNQLKLDKVETIYIKKNEESKNYNIDLNIEKPDYLSQLISVKFKQSITEKEIEDLVSKYNLTILDKYSKRYDLLVPPKKSVIEIVISLKKTNLTESVNINKKVRGS